MASPLKSLTGKGKRPSKTKSKKSKSKKLAHMHISPADNGGFNVSHLMEGEPDGAGMPAQSTETHALGGPDDLLQHVQSNFGGSLPAPAQAGPAAGGAPAGGM